MAAKADKPKPYPGERTFLEGRQHADSYVHVKRDWGTHYTLKLADCNRNVELNFPMGDARERRRSRAKLKRLRAVLDNLGAELERLEAEA